MKKPRIWTDYKMHLYSKTHKPANLCGQKGVRYFGGPLSVVELGRVTCKKCLKIAQSALDKN